jgi:hypothetical protein
MSDYNKILDYLSQKQADLKSPYANSDFVVHIDDALFMLRMFREIGLIVKRAYISTGAKASYWNVSYNDYSPPAFKVMVNIHRNTPRGEVYVIPHSAYNIRPKLEIKIERDYRPSWRYGFGINGKPFGDTPS